jgi:anti-anti-sigma factor
VTSLSQLRQPLLAIDTSHSTSETVIKLSGECDTSNVADFNATVIEILTSERRRIVFDVEELSFMDSSGLIAIERAIESLRPVGGGVVVQKPTWILKWLLDVFGIAGNVVIVE